MHRPIYTELKPRLCCKSQDFSEQLPPSSRLPASAHLTTTAAMQRLSSSESLVSEPISPVDPSPPRQNVRETPGTEFFSAVYLDSPRGDAGGTKPLRVRRRSQRIAGIGRAGERSQGNLANSSSSPSLNHVTSPNTSLAVLTLLSDSTTPHKHVVDLCLESPSLDLANLPRHEPTHHVPAPCPCEATARAFRLYGFGPPSRTRRRELR